MVFQKSILTLSRELAPLLGNIDIINKDTFSRPDEFVDFFKNGNYSRVVFFNPYEDEKIYEIYSWARKKEIPFFAVGEGALDRSIFFDETGYLDESNLYKQELRYHPLNDQEKEDIDNFIIMHKREIKSKKYNLKITKKLNLFNARKKVILVHFQKLTEVEKI